MLCAGDGSGDVAHTGLACPLAARPTPPAAVADCPEAAAARARRRHPARKGKPSGVWVTHQKMRQAEKQLAAQAQASHERAVRDWQASAPKNKQVGASVTPERA